MKNSQLPKRPTLLGFFCLVLMAQAIFLPLLAIYFAFDSPDTIIINNGIETKLGEIRFQVVGGLIIWSLFAALGFGLWRGLSWSRHAFVGILTIMTIATIFFEISFETVIQSLIAVALLSWYFYGIKGVKKFFGNK